MKPLQILEKLIQFNTVEDKENQQIIKWVAKFLIQFGFSIEIVKNNKNGKCNLIATYGQNPVLAFSGHTDTVPAGKNWTYDPFKMQVKGDRVYGLGACDMKGGISVFLSAISQVDLRKLKSGLAVYLTYDEEINFTGIIDSIAKQKIVAKNIIIAEPTDLVPISATKGVCAYKVKFKGKTCHASDANKGVNAIILANQFINELNDSFAEIQKQTNNIFSPREASLNIAKIQGGEAINKVPEACALEFEFRTVLEGQTKTIKQWVQALSKKYQADFSETLSVEPMLSTGKFTQTIEKICAKKSQGVNYVTEGSFMKNFDNNVVILGPGPNNAHISDEWVDLKSLEGAVEIYKKIMSSI